ncbi:BtpA/SgcQ family protein [Mesorhizobium sp. YM1C-6-2]|uniref:BtpA/SgcQ family protein n=1 Tax=Mesorhizobium sp. YM1C-6-2 TaxID=1827501 RepID=UPI000EF1EA6C|nr:BtpA/SgcQ family protein [Mesorhizobium sp. YM1C-6-2]RLP23157.1 BtpA family membrane complex biogenesis protein [Mesorhizobium sp. YM1C-6-2]
MQISGSRPSALDTIFETKIPLIGDIHLPPLPGTPRYRGESMASIVDQALRDAEAFEKGGVDGIIIENHGDIPFLKPDEIGPEIIAAMSAITARIVDAAGVPIGVNLLANAAIGALAIAKAGGARFIRVNQWVNAYIANEGLVEGESARALRFRKQIDATDVAIFADVHVKHGSHAIVADRPVSEQASDVEFYDADVAIATGNRTGDEVPEREISSIREGTRLPVIAGSGITPANAPRVLPLLDGAIVGSSLKEGGVWWNPVELERVKALVEAVKPLRESR